MVIPVSLFERFRNRERPEMVPDDEQAIRQETEKIRARQQLEQIAQQIGGPGTRVKDPDTFTRFLAQMDQQSRTQGGGGIGEIAPQPSPQPAPDMGARILPREQRANPERLEAFRAGAPRGTLERAEMASLPLAAFSPATLAGTFGGAAAQEGATRAGAPVPVQIAAGLAGGIAAGSPESVVGAAKLGLRGAQAAGRVAAPVADRAINVAQGRQVAHAATEPPIPPEGSGDILGDIGRELRTFSSNKAAARQFVNESLRPLFEKTFGESPVMDVLVPYGNMPIVDASGRAMSHEPLITISTAGWRARAEQLGLKYAGTHGPDSVYRIPGLELPTTPSATGIQPAAAGLVPPRPPIPPEGSVPPSGGAPPPSLPPPGGAGGGMQPPDEPVARLVGAIQNVKRLSPQLRSELAEKRRLDLGTRVGVGMERAADVAPSRKAGALRSALSGEMSKIPALEPVRGQFSPDDIESLYGRIWNSSLRDLEKGNASDALTRVLLPEGLDVPTPSEMTLLERVFGPDMRRALEDISKGQGRRIWEATVDVLNIPRALKSSFDISAPFRQGAILTISHPQKAFGGKDSAFVRMLRAFRSPEAHQESLARITSDPDFDLIAGAGRKNRLFIADAAETKITAREEGFASRWASRIPGIKGSQRAFNTYLNEMKWKTAKSYVDGLRKEGVNVTPDSQGLDTMTRFLNVATGRGKLGFLERRQLIQEMATTAFWSPRLTVSRFQVPVEGLRAMGSLRSADPALRAASRQIAGDLVKYTGSVLGFLTFLKLSGLAEVEVDPRSSDFGKIRVGTIRVDAWAGFQQPMRYTAQLIMGQSKPITGKGIEDKPRDEVFGKFLRSKLSPGAVSEAATFLPEDLPPVSGTTGGGRTFIGERIVPGPAKPYKTVPDRTKSLHGELLDTFAVPLIYNDIEEAIRSEGLVPGAIFGAAPLVGFGVTTIPEEGPSNSKPTPKKPQRQPTFAR